MIIITININHEEDKTVIEEGEITNIFVIKNIFFERKSYVREPNVDIWDDLEIIVTVIWWPEESDPIRIIQSANNTFSVFIGET